MCKSKRLPSHVRKLNICIAGKEVFLIKSFPKTTITKIRMIFYMIWLLIINITLSKRSIQ